VPVDLLRIRNLQHHLLCRRFFFKTLKSKNIKSAVYFEKPLWYNTEDFKAYEATGHWSSSQMLWGNKSNSGGFIAGTSILPDRYFALLMTDFIKACFDDPEWEKESIGFLMRAENENAYGIMATSDNALYVPFLKIDLEKLPGYFDSNGTNKNMF